MGTSIALFIGFTRTGPIDKPVLCTSYSDYARAFGEDLTVGDMTRQVKLFFLNGGTQCYVVRVAEGSNAAGIALLSEAGDALVLAARNPGVAGNLIRAVVTYSGTQPEDSFNLELFRWEALPNGTLVAKDAEVWRGLSMDPDAGSYAPNVLQANSKLIGASVPVVPVAGTASSYAMLELNAGAGDSEFAAAAAGAIVEVSVNGSRYVTFNVSPLPGGSTEAIYAAAVVSDLNGAFTAQGLPPPTGLSARFETSGTHTWFVLESTDGNVLVRRSGSNPGAAALRWGTEQGGIEVTRYAAARPVPSGVSIPGGHPDFAVFEALLMGTTADIDLDFYDASGGLVSATVTATWTAGDPLLTILGTIRDAIVAGPTPPLSAGETWPWTAELWGHRLAIRPLNGPLPAGADDNRIGNSSLSGALATATVIDNTRYYSFGITGASAFTSGPAGGSDGSVPTLATTYDSAYDLARREVDLFNLLLLPRSADESALALEDLWPDASLYAEERRALLLMEPPLAWAGTQTPMNEISTLRIGLSKQHAALYYPRLMIREGRVNRPVGAAGAVAGLMARTDSARGVWKAPAGTEADLRGVVGIAELLSDRENGVLNPRGINVIRSFPNGIVSWGARTMDGDDGFASEYKYVPVRRLALYIEESLYRGLRWVVFEGNDETLWAQIRLNVGAFMQGLYRQGAFQGTVPSQAYFVKCDSETTTQNDINLGIVNVWVGFAPLKPAEFVILSLQQMAGQIEV